MNVLPGLVTHVLAAACALAFSFAAQVQPPVQPSDMSRELAAKIAEAVAPFDEIQLLEVPDESREIDVRPTIRDVASLLRERNIRLVQQASDRAAQVRVTCSENLRDRVCAADVRKGDSREAVFVTRPRSVPATAPSPVAALDVRPLFAQRLPILDVAEIGDRLLVLDVAGLTFYEHGEQGWKATSNAPIAASRPWPRDVRGRLHVDGGTVAAFLPGVACRGTSDPLQVTCAESQEPWAVGVPGSIMDPRANYFNAPKAAPFFSAASLGPAGWLTAGVDGKMRLLGGALETRDTWPGISDDLAGLTNACAPPPQVVVSLADRDREGLDTLRAYQVTDRGLVAQTPPASMPGPITALWDMPGGAFVLAVTHNLDSERYEAFKVGIACAR